MPNNKSQITCTTTPVLRGHLWD